MHNNTTFRGYTSIQAQEYVQRRGGYPQRLIDELISLHTQSGGGKECVLDLGCGPGNATREIASHFDTAIGLDPSAEMINIARQVGEHARRDPIKFLQSDAESCDGIPDGSVDLIAAATSAHWFEMEKCWPAFARVLKPGGLVAFFTIWRIYLHPKLTPHAEQIQQILHELEQGTLGPYQKHGNWLLMNLYKDLEMPWTISPPCEAFAQSSYRYQVWNEHGIVDEDGGYVCGERKMTLDECEKAVATISAVTRWREAHPELANTDRDCVEAAFARIREILRPYETEEITMVGPTVLVTVQKSDPV